MNDGRMLPERDPRIWISDPKLAILLWLQAVLQCGHLM